MRALSVWPCALVLACQPGEVSSDAGTTSDSGATTTSTRGSSSTTGDDESDTGTLTDDEPPTLPSCPSERSEIDRPDDSPLPQVRVLYVIPADLEDEALDTNDRICNSVRAWTQWLLDETNGRALRLDTADGVLDIGFVRLELDDAIMHGSSEAADIDTGVAYVRDRIERELVLAGHIDSNKLYAVYYGGTSEYACGGGAYPPVIVDQVAAMYLFGEIPGFLPCDDEAWGEPDLVPRYLDIGMLHELTHTLGAVDVLAPNQHASGHTYDADAPAPERDLMYSARAGQADPPWDTPAGLVLDFGRDDYFEHGDPNLVDLARSVFLQPLPADPQLPPAW